MRTATSLLDVPLFMTAEQFIDWPGDGVNHLHQLIEGEPVAMVQTSVLRGVVCARLAGLLGNHLTEIGAKCYVAVTPGVQLGVRSSRNVRVPDLGVSCGRIDSHYMRDPLVLVEVLSSSNVPGSSNVLETREAVRAYLSIPSVREVIVISSVRVAAETLRREEDGSWPADPSPVGPDDQLTVATFGFSCALAEIYPG